MTIALSTRKSGPYTATAGQTTFNYDFPLENAADLVVVRLRGETRATLANETDYIVTGVGGDSGTFVLNVGALDGDEYVALGRIPIERNENFPGWKSLPDNAINLALDRMTIALQEMRRDVDGTITVDPFSGQTDAHGQRVQHVEDPQEDDDAATKGWTEELLANVVEDVGSIEAAKNAAETAAQAAMLAAADIADGIAAGIYAVTWFGAVGDGVHDDTAKIQDAINTVVGEGGGMVLLPRKPTFLVSDTLVVTGASVSVMGAGVDAATIKLANGANVPVLKIHHVAAGRLGGFTIDGNSANQGTPADGLQIDTSTDFLAQAFRIKNASARGVSLLSSTGALRRIRLADFYITDCGAHGVFINDDDTFTKQAIQISRGFVERPGRDTNLTLQACFKVSGWTQLTDCWAREFQDAAARYGYDFSPGDDDGGPAPATVGVGANAASAVNCNAYNTAYLSGTMGFRSQTRHLRLANCFTSECHVGYALYQQDATLVGCHAHKGRNGFQTFADSGFNTDGDKIMFLGCAAVLQSDGVTDGVGFQIGGDRNMLIGCMARNKNQSYGIASGALDTEIVGCVSLDPTTDHVGDSGTNTKIRNVSGFPTENKGQATFAIDSTGVKSVSIAHGLPFAPSQADIVLTMARNTNVSDFAIGWFRIKGNPDATNVFAEISVTTASGTSGATAVLEAQIRSK